MTFRDLKPLTVTLCLTFIITIPLSLMFGMIGFFGLFIFLPLLLIVLIFSSVYMYQSKVNKKLHFMVFYPLVLIIFFTFGFSYDMYLTNKIITELKQYGNIVEKYYKEKGKLPVQKEYKKIGIDQNCFISDFQDGHFEIQFGDGIYNSEYKIVNLRPRP